MLVWTLPEQHGYGRCNLSSLCKCVFVFESEREARGYTEVGVYMQKTFSLVSAVAQINISVPIKVN